MYNQLFMEKYSHPSFTDENFIFTTLCQNAFKLNRFTNHNLRAWDKLKTTVYAGIRLLDYQFQIITHGIIK